MELVCVICQENIRITHNDQGESAQRISALVCGHVFHMFCIDKWLEQSQVKKSCPKCRFVVNNRNGNAAFQLFLELERLDSNSEDVPEDAATRAKRKKELDIAHNNVKRLQEKCSYLKNELDSLKIESVDLKTRFETGERLLSITKSRHRADLQELNQCRSELARLQSLVQSLRSTNTFINGSVQDAEEVVANDLLDKSQLALLCVTYKKDGQKLMKKLEEASDALDKCERENHVLRCDLNKATSQLEELRSVHRMAKPRHTSPTPNGNEENAVPPVTLVSPEVDRQVKRPRLVGSSSRDRLPMAFGNPRAVRHELFSVATDSSASAKANRMVRLTEKYDGFGGHASSSLFRTKCKIVTSRAVVRK